MMSAHQFLLTTLALLLVDALQLVPCHAAPAGGGELILNPSPMTDDLDMAILRRAMRQGNDCDSRVTHLIAAHPPPVPRDQADLWRIFSSFGSTAALTQLLICLAGGDP
jgi:hypothetical protein